MQTNLLAVRFASGGAHAHETESFEAFNTRYRNFFDSCNDLFELQRGLNNCFAYDLVPTTEVVDSALRCARKVNDYATAVRILEGVREKVENKGQYKAYLEELKGTIEELGTSSIANIADAQVSLAKRTYTMSSSNMHFPHDCQFRGPLPYYPIYSSRPFR